MKNILKQIGAFLLDIFETLVIALSIFLIVYLFLMQPHQVNGQSMIPNFESGDYVLTDKISYRLGEPKRGDVVVFHAPSSANCPQGTGCDFIKRIVGLPGESIEVKNSQLFVNSEPLDEVYIPNEFQTEAGNFTKNKSISLNCNYSPVIARSVSDAAIQMDTHHAFPDVDCFVTLFLAMTRWPCRAIPINGRE